MEDTGMGNTGMRDTGMKDHSTGRVEGRLEGSRPLVSGILLRFS